MRKFVTRSLFLALAFIAFSGGRAFGQCQASFTAVDSGSCVVFTNTSVGFNPLLGGYGTWDFGDGNTANTTGWAGITHCYNVVGVYVVCLTVTDSMGCTSTWCDSVFNGSGGNCNAYFTYSSSACDVTFSDGSISTAGSWVTTWTFGDGTAGSGSNPTHSYTGQGPWYVCVTMTDTSGCSDSYCSWVSVPGCSGGNPCNINFGWVHDSTLAYTILLYPGGAFGGPAMSYLWDFGDGTTSTLAYPNHVYAGAGTYVVCVTVTDSNCTSTFCDSIPVTYKQNTPFSISVVEGTTAVQPPATPINVSVFPNPFQNELSVTMSLNESEKVMFELMDMTGRVVLVKNEGTVNAGDFSGKLNTGKLPAGAYLLRVTAGENTVVKNVIAN